LKQKRGLGLTVLPLSLLLDYQKNTIYYGFTTMLLLPKSGANTTDCYHYLALKASEYGKRIDVAVGLSHCLLNVMALA